VRIASDANLWLYLLIAVAAAVYSSVGQGGGSGYITVMALFALDPALMKPAALTMNVFVTSLVWWRGTRAAKFRWDILWPFAIGSLPMALIGGAIDLDPAPYRMLVGMALLIAAGRMLWSPLGSDEMKVPRRGLSLGLGSAMGLFAGITGVGGGIFLAPLLIYFGWCGIAQVVTLSAAFIWINSLAALAGYAATFPDWPAGIPGLVVAAVAGSVAGGVVAARWASPAMLQRVLGLVLVMAGLKLIFFPV
jgi:uncharacterized membrane protein YfcA